MRKYYRLMKDYSIVGVKAKVGSICRKTVFNGNDLDWYYFPSTDSEVHLRERHLKEISEEEYMKEIWRLEKNI